MAAYKVRRDGLDSTINKLSGQMTLTQSGRLANIWNQKFVSRLYLKG